VREKRTTTKEKLKIGTDNIKMLNEQKI